MDPIVISIDFYPPAGSKPGTVVVAAAPKYGTPHLLSGPFSARHQLLDEAYGEAVKRAAKADKRAAQPKAGKGGKSGKAGKPTFGEPGHLPSKVEGDAATEFVDDDLVGDKPDTEAAETSTLETGPIGPAAPADLPVIEGDDPTGAEEETAQLQFAMEGEDDGN